MGRLKIESSEKKKIYPKLEKIHGKKRLRSLVHAVKIYYALKENIFSLPGIYICQDGSDKRWVLRYLSNLLGNKFIKDKIIILSSLKEMFGKENIADRLAREVTKNGKRPSILLKEKHFKKLKLL